MGFQTPLDRDLYTALNAVWEECSGDNPAAKILSDLWNKYRECLAIRPSVHPDDDGVWLAIPTIKWVHGEDLTDAMHKAQEEMLK